MTLKGIKDVLVEQNHVMENKEVNKLVINTGLMYGLFGTALSLVVSSALDIRMTLVTFILTALLFLWTLDACCEDLNFLNGWRKFAKLWFLNIPLIIGTYFALKFFMFI